MERPHRASGKGVLVDPASRRSNLTADTPQAQLAPWLAELVALLTDLRRKRESRHFHGPRFAAYVSRRPHGYSPPDDAA